MTQTIAEQVADLKAQGLSNREIARRLGCAEATIRRMLSLGVVRPVVAAPVEVHLPDPVESAGGPKLPEPILQSWEPFEVDTPGVWGVIGDLHLPNHDKATIEAFSRDCRERDVKGILLNGDVMDMFMVAPYFREPDKTTFLEELECGRQFFAWLRSRHPKARIIFKEGNHDYRLTRFVVDRAAVLYDLPELRLPALLHCEKYGIEFINDKRVINLGKLPVVHGHEFRGGGGVNPARWLFLRAVSSGMVSHFHRSSQHFETGLDRRVHGVWSIGCACFLHPRYDPTNKWNHGYAMVELMNDRSFSVINRVRLRDGRVV